MADPVRVNGNIFSWGSVEIRARDQVFVGVTAVNYSDTRERAAAYGTAPQRGPRGVTTGKYAAEGSVTMHTDSAARLREALDNGRGSYGDEPFDIVVSYGETGLPPHTVELRGCLIVGDSGSPTEGTDPTADELQLWIERIVRDDRTLAEVE